jgi:anti-sigma B factor antagonist
MPVPVGCTIEAELRGSTLEVRVRGELDLSTAPRLTDALSDAAKSDAETTVLDLSGVTFIDSSALRVLVVGGRALADAGRVLQIGPRSEMVARVLAMTSLDKHSDAFEVLPQPS